MLNAVTLAAIVAAVWAHPQGVAYLDKIEQVRVCAEANGNPCCSDSGGGGGGGRIEPDPVSREYLRALYEYEELDRRKLAEKSITADERKPVALAIPDSVKLDVVKQVESMDGNPNKYENDAIVLAVAALFVLE